jgi:hypothetical protein
MENTKKLKKLLEENWKIYINEKSIPEWSGKCQILVEKDQIYKIKKFHNVFSTNECLIDKENPI